MTKFGESVVLLTGLVSMVTLLSLNPNTNWGSSTKMMLEPVTIWSGRGSSTV
jgi:hypothetical protein